MKRQKKGVGPQKSRKKRGGGGFGLMILGGLGVSADYHHKMGVFKRKGRGYEPPFTSIRKDDWAKNLVRCQSSVRHHTERVKKT